MFYCFKSTRLSCYSMHIRILKMEIWFSIEFCNFKHCKYYTRESGMELQIVKLSELCVYKSEETSATGKNTKVKTFQMVLQRIRKVMEGLLNPASQTVTGYHLSEHDPKQHNLSLVQWPTESVLNMLCQSNQTVCRKSTMLRSCSRLFGIGSNSHCYMIKWWVII